MRLFGSGDKGEQGGKCGASETGGGETDGNRAAAGNTEWF